MSAALLSLVGRTIISATREVWDLKRRAGPCAKFILELDDGTQIQFENGCSPAGVRLFVRPKGETQVREIE